MSEKARLSRPQRRQAILETASQLFSERGFRGVTTRDLASAVGVSEPVLYEHFSTKEELYSAIIESELHPEGGDCHQWLRDASTLPPAAYFTRLAEIIDEFYTRRPQHIRQILFAALEGHQLANVCFRNNAGPLFSLVAEYIEKQIAAGVFRPVEPTVASRAFLGMVMHYCLFELHFGFQSVRAPKERALAGLVDIFLQGVQKS